MAVAAVDDSELEYSTAPSVPATIPGAVGILVVKNAFHPSVPNQVGPACGQDEGGPLNIRVGNAEVIMRVAGDLFRQIIHGVVQLRRAAVVVAIYDQRQELMLPRSPDVPGRREHVSAVAGRKGNLVGCNGIGAPSELVEFAV